MGNRSEPRRQNKGRLGDVRCGPLSGSELDTIYGCMGLRCRLNSGDVYCAFVRCCPPKEQQTCCMFLKVCHVPEDQRRPDFHPTKKTPFRTCGAFVNTTSMVVEALINEPRFQMIIARNVSHRNLPCDGHGTHRVTATSIAGRLSVY